MSETERELCEALELATQKLRRCMAFAGNADFAIDACCEQFDSALAKARANQSGDTSNDG
jgi:hypothetical protein